MLERLKWIEKRRKQDRYATLLVAIGEGGPIEAIFAESLKGAFAVEAWTFNCTKATRENELKAEVRWRAYAHDIRQTEFIRILLDLPGVASVEGNQ